jgi:hypothetical protein
VTNSVTQATWFEYELVDRFVRATEANEVGNDDAVPGRHERGHHRAVQVAPHRLAMQQQDGLRGIGRPDIDVRHVQSARQLQVARFPRVVDDSFEAVVRRAQHAADSGNFAVEGGHHAGVGHAGTVVAAMMSLTTRPM